jgi:NADH:ubiquinone oxidoreductase subunit 6 (subunit J)
MLEILALIIGLAAVLVVLLFVIIVIGIRQEPQTEELREQAPSLIAAFVRRLLGAYVHKPDSPLNLAQGDNGHVSLRTTPFVAPTDKPNAT